MRPKHLAAFLVFCVIAVFGGDAPANYSSVVMQKGELLLTVTLQGYYQGSRFDHGPVVTRAIWRGHQFLDDHAEFRRPWKHDHSAGITGEFGIDGAVQGFEESDRHDGCFVKIGVGVIKKTDGRGYRFSRRYAQHLIPPWKVVEQSDTELVTEQQLSWKGWGYRLRKTILLHDDGQAFSVIHMLANTGTRAIETNHYSHNFLTLDRKPMQSGYFLRYAPSAQLAEHGEGTAMTNGLLKILGPDTGGQHALARLAAMPRVNNHVILTHAQLNVGIRLDHDYDASEIAVYASRHLVCPEHFVAISLKPGQSQTWTTTYTLFLTQNPG